MADTPISPLRTAQREARRLLIEGDTWLVYELPLAFDRRSSPSLIFEHPASVRRVRNYPADWRTLTDAELVALSWTA